MSVANEETWKITACGYWFDLGGKNLTEAEVKLLFEEGGLQYENETIEDWLARGAAWEETGFGPWCELRVNDERIEIGCTPTQPFYERRVGHAYPLSSGAILCNMSANTELGHDAAYP